ncbi:hypothetical protein BpHYR1_026449 [Brachionus plicatilis]|uniref:Uncharacterized protein n=1 Tax=Brachionus plicatilis TaxID=10195 RepID=A0A3M7QXH5_BRAPC|nr:hypothetical protein BpHYR1_026449 [Brachionus plicatilis]
MTIKIKSVNHDFDLVQKYENYNANIFNITIIINCNKELKLGTEKKLKKNIFTYPRSWEKRNKCCYLHDNREINTTIYES